MSSENRASVQVVGIGEILWDMLPEGRRIGGAPTNFAYHANARGVRAAAVSCVGTDPPGDEILERIAEWNMEIRYICRRSEYPTGVVQVHVDAKGVPEYVIEENVAWDHIPWSDDLAALASSVRAVCFGTLGQRAPESRATIRRFVNGTEPACLRVCDINLRQSYFNTDILRESIRMANVLKLNHEELPVIAGQFGMLGSQEAVLSELRSTFDLDLIALTKGSGGSALLTATQRSEHPGFPVDVVDTVGAGDAFTAALVVGLLSGEGLDTINANANRAASQTCLHAGAIPAEIRKSVVIASPPAEKEMD